MPPCDATHHHRENADVIEIWKTSVIDFLKVRLTVENYCLAEDLTLASTHKTQAWYVELNYRGTALMINRPPPLLDHHRALGVGLL